MKHQNLWKMAVFKGINKNEKFDCRVVSHNCYSLIEGIDGTY